MKSVHYINRANGISREGLTHLGQGRYRSCCWLLTIAQTQEIVGGYIYLHQTKLDPSAFGGKIVRCERGVREEAANPEGYAIIFHATASGRGQRWRGEDHIMAYWSGLVEPDFPHESTYAA